MYAHFDETFGNDRGKVLGTYEASGAGALFIMFLVYGALLGIIGTRNVLVITAIPALVMGTLLIRARMMDASPALFFLFLLTIMLRIASVMAVLNFLFHRGIAKLFGRYQRAS